MYETLIVAVLMAILGGVGNILYEKYYANGTFVLSKELLLKRLGTAAVAGFLLFYGLSEAPQFSYDVVGLANDFGMAELAAFLGFAVQFVMGGYFADDVIDIAIDKFTKKPEQDNDTK